MTLVICYGNPGRGDDGLGPEFALRLEARDLPEVEVLSEFQLKVEHAVRLAETDRVVFVDAALSGDTPYLFSELAPAAAGDLSSHSVSPETVLALAQMHFGATCPAYVLAITGTAFDLLHDGLSASAAANLEAAEAFFLDWLAVTPV